MLMQKVNSSLNKKDISVTQDLLFTIIKYGFSIKEVAEALALSYNTVKRWKNGTEPKFHHFQKLVRFYATTVCKY